MGGCVANFVGGIFICIVGMCKDPIMIEGGWNLWL